MITLVWLLLVPFILGGILYFLLPSIKPVLRLQVIGLLILINALVITFGFMIGVGSKTTDTEILNGEILNKERIHDSYVHSYQCNCQTVTSGSGSKQTSTQVCQTCYEDHYTVEWKCDTTLGDIRLDKLDETSKKVYDEPDPGRYAIIQKGAVAKEHSYVNYIKAVPQTLFKSSSSKLKEEFLNQIPEYPEVYDYYKVDRVFGVDVNIPNSQEWNNKLSILLKKLGPQKQTNVIILVVKTSNPNYFYALQDAWINGKKNDIVVILGGVTDLSKPPTWARVLAYSENDLFRVKIRDDLLSLTSIQVDSVLGIIDKNTMKYYVRKPMASYEYLKNEVEPPEWVINTLIILCVISFVGSFIYIKRSFK